MDIIIPCLVAEETKEKKELSEAHLLFSSSVRTNKVVQSRRYRISTSVSIDGLAAMQSSMDVCLICMYAYGIHTYIPTSHTYIHYYIHTCHIHTDTYIHRQQVHAFVVIFGCVCNSNSPFLTLIRWAHSLSNPIPCKRCTYVCLSSRPAGHFSEPLSPILQQLLQAKLRCSILSLGLHLHHLDLYINTRH